MEMKKCTHCGQLKPVAEFSKHNSNSDGLQHWCKECCNEHNRGRKRGNSVGRGKPVRINLEPYMKDILVYRRTHTLRQVSDWIKRQYGVSCGETTISLWIAKWEGKNEQSQPEIKPVTIADFDDAALITELRKRGYRVYYERFIKSKWGNHYKKRMVEAVGNTDNK